MVRMLAHEAKDHSFLFEFEHCELEHGYFELCQYTHGVNKKFKYFVTFLSKFLSKLYY